MLKARIHAINAESGCGRKSQKTKTGHDEGACRQLPIKKNIQRIAVSDVRVLGQEQ